jgi:hypothetical protein
MKQKINEDEEELEVSERQLHRTWEEESILSFDEASEIVRAVPLFFWNKHSQRSQYLAEIGNLLISVHYDTSFVIEGNYRSSKRDIDLFYYRGTKVKGLYDQVKTNFSKRTTLSCFAQLGCSENLLSKIQGAVK